MAEREDSDREVLTSLPRSRPVRRSSKRSDRPPTADGAPNAQSPPAAPQRKVPAAGYAARESRTDEGTPSPAADLIGTVLQAASELAQIGMTVGRQTLRSMLDRLPKP